MANCSNILKPSDFGGSLSCAQLETTLNEVEVMCGELNGLLGGSPPEFDEQLNISAPSISIPGIHNATVIQHFRNGVLQSQNYFTVSTDTITPTSLGGGDYSEDNLSTYWW